MTFDIAFNVDLRDLSLLELEDARATVGARKMEMRGGIDWLPVLSIMQRMRWLMRQRDGNLTVSPEWVTTDGVREHVAPLTAAYAGLLPLLRPLNDRIEAIDSESSRRQNWWR